MKKKGISVVVPCYNEEYNIKPFFEETIKAIEGYDYEFVFVNDGSRDNTLEELKKLLKEKNIKIVDFSRNFGKESAIYAGLVNSEKELTVLIDADLQQNPKYIRKMADFLSNNKEYDMIAMYQSKRKEGILLSFFKRNFYKLINKLSDVEFINGASDFRMFRNNVKEALLELQEQNRFSKGIFSWVGFNVKYMEYEVEPRKHGNSKWSFKKLFNYALKGIMSFSLAPLKVATISGVIASLASLVYLIVVILQKLIWGINIPGYATIIVLLLFFGGLELLVMGIIGSYIGAIYIESKRRPIYISKKIYNNNKSKED